MTRSAELSGNSIVDIGMLLHRLGVTANYTGFLYTSYAVSLCVENAERLLLVTKWLYPEIAKHFNTSWQSVERDIRTVISVVWNNNPLLLFELAGYQLAHKPHTAQFLAILTEYYLHNTAT